MKARMLALVALIFAALAAPALATHDSDYLVVPQHAGYAQPYHAAPPLITPTYQPTYPPAYTTEPLVVYYPKKYRIHPVQYAYAHPRAVPYANYGYNTYPSYAHNPYRSPYGYNTYPSYAHNPYYPYNVQPPVILDSYRVPRYSNAQVVTVDDDRAVVVIDTDRPYDFPNLVNPGRVYVHEDSRVTEYD